MTLNVMELRYHPISGLTDCRNDFILHCFRHITTMEYLHQSLNEMNQLNKTSYKTKTNSKYI